MVFDNKGVDFPKLLSRYLLQDVKFGTFAIDFTQADSVDFHVLNDLSQRVGRHRDLPLHIEFFPLAIAQINRVHYAALPFSVDQIRRSVLSGNRPRSGCNILFESIASYIFLEDLETLREGFEGIDPCPMVSSVARENPLVRSDI